ncbi:hypothetical protein [Streptomyces sp. NPDC058424]|uniref:hypothetical protein n=1 Tax=Streptomyces sp. NPDC058424 TaxID=3346491 RepID=UPI00364BD386
MTDPRTDPVDLSSLARPSGAFAMVAVDQREALRAMFAERHGEPVPDERLTEFKLAAVRTLTPYASAVLVDRDFALDRVIEEKATAAGCALIAAADRFLPGPGEFVADVEIDEAVDPAGYAAQGVAALKLLVIHRPDEAPEPRIAMVRRFVDRCRAAGLISIIEPVSRPPRDGRDWDWNACVLAAAEELGALGADLYKAEIPLHGEGDEAEIRRRCAHITAVVASPWVVLSSGVRHEVFPRAVGLACAAGASGFLAGRAVWRPVIGRSDVEAALRRISVPRLQELVHIVDEAVAAR